MPINNYGIWTICEYLEDWSSILDEELSLVVSNIFVVGFQNLYCLWSGWGKHVSGFWGRTMMHSHSDNKLPVPYWPRRKCTALTSQQVWFISHVRVSFGVVMFCKELVLLYTDRFDVIYDLKDHDISQPQWPLIA